uniref:Uncharacterized protein n=1 Tax=Arundo donax TaxID=35708 RepID=A0A0A9AZR0_ARUDO
MCLSPKKLERWCQNSRFKNQFYLPIVMVAFRIRKGVMVRWTPLPSLKNSSEF